mgnify:FL=1
MPAILITTTISAIAAVMWALCAADTSAEEIERAKEDEEDETFRT